MQTLSKPASTSYQIEYFLNDFYTTSILEFIDHLKTNYSKENASLIVIKQHYFDDSFFNLGKYNPYISIIDNETKTITLKLKVNEWVNLLCV